MSVFYRSNVLSTARYMEVLQPINASVSSSVRHRLALPGVWCLMKQEPIDKSIGIRVEVSLFTEEKNLKEYLPWRPRQRIIKSTTLSRTRFSQCILNELLVLFLCFYCLQAFLVDINLYFIHRLHRYRNLSETSLSGPGSDRWQDIAPQFYFWAKTEKIYTTFTV